MVKIGSLHQHQSCLGTAPKFKSTSFKSSISSTKCLNLSESNPSRLAFMIPIASPTCCKLPPKSSSANSIAYRFI